MSRRKAAPTRRHTRGRFILGGLVAVFLALGGSGAAADGDASAPVEAPAPPEDPGASAVLNKWILALGGPYELRDLRTLDAHCQIDTGGGPIDVHLRAVARGGLYRYDYNLPKFGVLIQAFNGVAAWQRNDTLGFGPLTATEHVVNRLGSDFRAPLHIGSAYPRRVLLPDVVEGKRRLRVVEMGLRDGKKERWYFDADSGQRVRIELTYLTPAVVLEFDDFRSAFGAAVKEPYHILRRQGAAKVDVRMKVILYNEDMDEAMFNPSLPQLQENSQIEEVLAANARFRGGAAAADIQTRVAEQEAVDATAGTRVRRTIYQKRPNLLAIEEDVPGLGQVWQGFDGQIGWVWNEVEGFRQMEGAELQQMLGSADFDGPLRLAAACPLRRWLGDKEVNGRQLVGIALATPAGPAGTFYFDAKTHELAQLETFVQTGPEGHLRVLAEFSDYRPVGGLMVPFSTWVTNATMRMQVTTKSIRHNVPIEDGVFVPRRE